MESYITVPSLERWQHYKDRCPPWIKLHRDLLNDYKFSCLQDASKAHLLAIWLLASQMDNKIPNDSCWIEKKINATQPLDLEYLITCGFLDVLLNDSKALADCKQYADGETETEAEAETKAVCPHQKNTTKNGKNTTKDEKRSSYSEEFEAFWKEYPNKKGKFKASLSWKTYGCDNGIFDSIMESLSAHKKSSNWTKENGAYIPHGSTWVHGKGWEDETDNQSTSEWVGE